MERLRYVSGKRKELCETKVGRRETAEPVAIKQDQSDVWTHGFRVKQSSRTGFVHSRVYPGSIIHILPAFVKIHDTASTKIALVSLPFQDFHGKRWTRVVYQAAGE